MDEDPGRRAEELFQQAAELPREAREAFVAGACGNDPALRDSVLRLIAALDGMCGFLERPPHDLERALLEGEALLPERIGRYEIVRVAGKGGSGIVFEARQERPGRRVAIKIVHPLLASPRWLMRFRREAELLGRLSHPGVASVYEAGVVDVEYPGGARIRMPYLAMEYVEGVPLDVHASRGNLDTRCRLELVASVADSMQHAHEHGIVHRDLKPANILVDAQGRTKVVDFGIARTVWDDQRTPGTDLDVDSCLPTPTADAGGRLAGTISYMSPEQAGGRTSEIDARSDVYTLGVVLYELLCGRVPLDLRGRTIPEMLRAIRENEPPPPGSLNPALSGDVEAILGKALSKQRELRYASAEEMADDIRRCVRGEPL